MNVQYSGKTDIMRSSIQFPSILNVGDTQLMNFPTIDYYNPMDGPFWLSPQDKIKYQETILYPIIVEKDRTKWIKW